VGELPWRLVWLCNFINGGIATSRVATLRSKGDKLLSANAMSEALGRIMQWWQHVCVDPTLRYWRPVCHYLA